MSCCKKNRHFKRLKILNSFSTALAILVLFQPQSYASGSAKSCAALFSNLDNSSSSAFGHREIKTFDDLLMAFTEGFSPNLKDKDQRTAFEIYRKMRFGDPDTNLTEGSLDSIAKQLSKHPELIGQQVRFRNYELDISEKSYPVTEALGQFLSSQVRSSGQVRANLYQIDANLGFWKKALGYEEPARFREKVSDKKERKALKQEANQHFLDFLGEYISIENRANIADSKTPIRDRARLLYSLLLEARKNLQVRGTETRQLDQAIVDLIHTVGYFDPSTQRQLKSDDGLQRLGAYRKVLAERDSFAMELRYENHFEQVLATFSVAMPTGMPSRNGLAQKIGELESEIIAKAETVGGSRQRKSIRHLSLLEAPFRSCLGGSDCSSRTYLTRALDPNYHYFTITDVEGYSSGHITVVLGTARINGKSEKIAFIDKVQNVDNVDMPIMIEGIRRSALEEGYILALPKDVGDDNGISNESTTRIFVKRNILIEAETSIDGFKPHSHEYSFPNQYSRAEYGLLMHPIRELGLNQDIVLNRGVINRPWETSGFRLEELVQASIELKNGDLGDRLRYIPSMRAIETAGLKGDPKFDGTLRSWVSDSRQDFRLRKQVLIFEWSERKTPLAELLTHFNSGEQVNLIQNLLDTPRYRKLIVKNKKQIPALLTFVRDNRKVRDILVDAYDSKISELVVKVLEAHEFSNAKVAEIIVQIKESFESVDIDAMVKVLKLVERSQIEAEFEVSLIRAYVSSINSDAALGRGLSASLNSDRPVVQRFGQRILDWSENLEASHYPILKVYREIMTFHEKGPSGRTLEESGQLWMADVSVRADLKADFLMAQVGQGRRVFDRLLARIPQGQREAMWRRIEDRSSVKTFLDIAESKGIRDFFLDEAVMESFLYESHFTPTKEHPKTYMMGESGSRVEMTLSQPFEMGATQITQLQYALVMGENPSRFKGNGKVLTLQEKTLGFSWKSKDVQIDPNRPMENVSWNDAVKYIEHLNELSPHFKYDLPTEVQWEFAARAKTETTYSFGEEASELSRHGWYSENSGNQTQPVARLRANQFGLFDMHGNVWEWTRDWYDDLPSSPRTDYEGPNSGSYRVLRGGGWPYGDRNLRSAVRSYGRPGNSYNHVGFRLVRTAK